MIASATTMRSAPRMVASASTTHSALRWMALALAVALLTLVAPCTLAADASRALRVAWRYRNAASQFHAPKVLFRLHPAAFYRCGHNTDPDFAQGELR